MNGGRLCGPGRAWPKLITGYADVALEDQLAPERQVIGKPFTLKAQAAKM